MQYQHFFWDFDGTLYNSYPRVIQACRLLLADYQQDVPEDILLGCAKVSLKHLMHQHVPAPHDEEELFERYKRYESQLGDEPFSLYPGAAQFLQAAHDAGARHYLWTHRDQSAVQALQRDGLLALFDDVITAENGFAHKPAPGALQHLLAKHLLDSARCVMVGDRDIDLDAAKSIGVATILFDPDGFYAAYPADWRFASYEAMQEVFFPQAKK